MKYVFNQNIYRYYNILYCTILYIQKSKHIYSTYTEHSILLHINTKETAQIPLNISSKSYYNRSTYLGIGCESHRELSGGLHHQLIVGQGLAGLHNTDNSSLDVVPALLFNCGGDSVPREFIGIIFPVSWYSSEQCVVIYSVNNIYY